MFHPFVCSWLQCQQCCVSRSGDLYSHIHFIYATHTHKSWDLVAEIVFCNSFWSRTHQCENMPGRSTIRSSSVFIHFLVKLHKNCVSSTNFDPTLMPTVFKILTSLYPKLLCCIYTLSSINQNRTQFHRKKKTGTKLFHTNSWCSYVKIRGTSQSTTCTHTEKYAKVQCAIHTVQKPIPSLLYVREKCQYAM